eukprot:CCRYP_010206-RA/>CCRYP_010206-RA protein AED:0.61 eAED:0.61 QI:0/-1/0/1/-1/1/1/0/63
MYKNVSKIIALHGFRCTRGKKLAAPIKPELSGTTDTSNFEEYPEDAEELLRPEYDGPDPFEDF